MVGRNANNSTINASPLINFTPKRNHLGQMALRKVKNDELSEQRRELALLQEIKQRTKEIERQQDQANLKFTERVMHEQSKWQRQNVDKYESKRQAKHKFMEVVPNLNEQNSRRDEETYKVGEANFLRRLKQEDERFTKKILARESLKKATKEVNNVILQDKEMEIIRRKFD